MSGEFKGTDSYKCENNMNELKLEEILEGKKERKRGGSEGNNRKKCKCGIS